MGGANGFTGLLLLLVVVLFVGYKISRLKGGKKNSAQKVNDAVRRFKDTL